jgi:penicillin-binding protein 1C
MKSRLKRFARRGAIAVAVLLVTAIAAAWCGVRLFPLDATAFLATRASGALLDREGQPLYRFLNADQSWCFPNELNSFSPRLIEATLAVEDQRFFQHPGVDPIAALRAVWQNLRGQRVSSGASTVTMQVVRLGGNYRRTWGWKLWQAFAALRLERAADKDTILTAYLNKAPYGLNLVGAEAAAQRYFGKPALELTLPEAALLAGMPKAPTTFEPLSHPDAAKRRRDHVLARMRDEGYLSPTRCAEAQAEPLGVARHTFPQHAPHLAMRHRAQLRNGGAIRTTIDGEIQAMAEEIAAKYLRRFDNEITNAAIIVVDPTTSNIIARVGSAGFFSGVPGSEVDICTAPRARRGRR